MIWLKTLILWGFFEILLALVPSLKLEFQMVEFLHCFDIQPKKIRPQVLIRRNSKKATHPQTYIKLTRIKPYIINKCQNGDPPTNLNWIHLNKTPDIK